MDVAVLSNTVQFSQMNPGETFRIGGEYFIVSQAENNAPKLATNLSCGTTIPLTRTTMVTPIKLQVVLKGE